MEEDVIKILLDYIKLLEGALETSDPTGFESSTRSEIRYCYRLLRSRENGFVFCKLRVKHSKK